jgi:hypothetical protein
VVGEKLGYTKQDGSNNKSGNLVNFLDKLPKLPSHYCRKVTNKLYLEETFKTVSDVYNLYKKQCESSLKNMSLTSFMKAIDEKNIGVFTPRQDRCDLCEKYKHQNLDQEDKSKKRKGQ